MKQLFQERYGHFWTYGKRLVAHTAPGFDRYFVLNLLLKLLRTCRYHSFLPKPTMRNNNNKNVLIQQISKGLEKLHRIFAGFDLTFDEFSISTVKHGEWQIVFNFIFLNPKKNNTGQYSIPENKNLEDCLGYIPKSNILKKKIEIHEINDEKERADSKD